MRRIVYHKNLFHGIVVSYDSSPTLTDGRVNKDRFFFRVRFPPMHRRDDGYELMTEYKLCKALRENLVPERKSKIDLEDKKRFIDEDGCGRSPKPLFAKRTKSSSKIISKAQRKANTKDFFCVNCGSGLPHFAKFCFRCGRDTFYKNA